LADNNLQKTADCLFVFSPDKESRGSCFEYHLGSAYIISYLKSQGFRAHQFIHSDPVNIKGCVKKILDYNVKIVGFTVYNSNFNISALIAAQIKKASPNTLIVLGGPCPSVHYEFIMSAYSFVDACFLNESEETFLQFITELSKTNFNYIRSDFSGINGISYRYSERIYTNPENHTIRNHSDFRNHLDKYPSPFLSGIIPPAESHKVGLLTARGCNQNCVYCNCAVLSDRRFSTHSIDRVVEELDLISRYLKSNQVLSFNDDAFTLIPHRAARICKALIENRINIQLSCITRCDCIDEGLLDLMREAGFVSIGFSLESANPSILRRIGKVHVAEDAPTHNLEKEIRFIESLDRMTAYAKKIGIKSIVVSIMVGLPGETINEAQQTIEAIDRNKNIDLYSHNFLSIFKGTPLFTDYKKYGYKIRNINNNPIFTEVTYPEENIRKISILPKSTLHQEKKYTDNDTLGILSLKSVQLEETSGFNNIILQSDRVQGKFVKWLKDILTINGTIIQIYSNEKAMTSLEKRNYEMFIKYFSPSLNIRSYCIRKIKDGFLLLSSQSLLLRNNNENDNIKISDFEKIKSGLSDSKENFIKTLCREADYRDSVAAFSFLCGVSREKDPFSYLIENNTLPYFANLCKWTRDVANCVNSSTLIINEKHEIRFCWYGGKMGLVGQSYNELIKNLESEKKEVIARRNCGQCEVRDNCIKCPFPFPLPETEYCKSKISTDVTHAAELIISLDQIKQVLL